MLKKDAFLFGLLIGLVLPVVFFMLLYFGGKLLVDIELFESLHDKGTIQLISIFVNLFPIKYYFVNLKYEQSGRGVLLMTFVLALLYFIIR